MLVVSHQSQGMGRLWLLGLLPGAAPLSLPAELPQQRVRHQWIGAEVGSGRMGRAPLGGAGAQWHIPGAQPQFQERHFWVGLQKPLQDTVAAQGRAVCQAGSSSQLSQTRSLVPRQGRLQPHLSQPWLGQGLEGWGWFLLGHWRHIPQRAPGRCLASWWLPLSIPGGRAGCHHPDHQAGLELELGPCPVKLGVLGSEQ